MAPRRRAAALAGAVVLALAVCQAPIPARAQTASSWLQVVNMLLKPRACSNGKTLAVCRRDPCAVTECPTGFKCRADYCGACAGVCEADAQADEADKAAAGSAPTCELTGQPGKLAVRPTCTTPMCTFMQCGKGSACVNDFCGGCTGTCVNATETMVTGALKPSIQGSSLASVKACRAGEYMSPSGCRQCIPGSVSAPGAAECTMCTMGSYANTTTNACDKCAPGFASAALRATSCSPCNGGRFSDKAGSVMCSACKEGFTTPRDKMPHTSCVVAPPAPVLPSKNGTAGGGSDGQGSVPDGVDGADDASFDDLFEDLDAEADAALTGSDNRKAAKAAKLAAMDKAAAADKP